MLCTSASSRTFHAVRKSHVELVVHVVGRHPVAQLALGAELGGGDGVSLQLGADVGQAFHASHVRRVRDRQPAARQGEGTRSVHDTGSLERDALQSPESGGRGGGDMFSHGSFRILSIKFPDFPLTKNFIRYFPDKGINNLRTKGK